LRNKDIKLRSYAYKNDILNKLKYGLRAPLMYERIWINPLDIEHIIYREEIHRVTGKSREEASGAVIDWDLIKNYSLLNEEYRIQYCEGRWNKGLSWEELGVYDFMKITKKYGDWPKEKVIKRFDNYDRVFEKVKKEKRLKTRNELEPSNFREKDGILIHIGPGGKPFFGGNGFHRLAMARVLELNPIPACIGVVDKKSIHLLKNLRR
jgi:hypothetical protein